MIYMYPKRKWKRAAGKGWNRRRKTNKTRSTPSSPHSRAWHYFLLAPRTGTHARTSNKNGRPQLFLFSRQHYKHVSLDFHVQEEDRLMGLHEKQQNNILTGSLLKKWATWKYLYGILLTVCLCSGTGMLGNGKTNMTNRQKTTISGVKNLK